MILDKMPVLALNRNEDGLTSLHIASLVNNIDIARILIEKVYREGTVGFSISSQFILL